MNGNSYGVESRKEKASKKESLYSEYLTVTADGWEYLSLSDHEYIIYKCTDS